MYKLLLILKYLRRKLAPMFAALAVTLCTMMVIIVISVMGGFLQLLTQSVQQLTGDVTVTSGSITGFPHYDELIEKLESQPEVAAATPMLQSYGLINLDGQTNPVQVHGVRGEGYDRIVRYRDSLYWSSRHYLDYIDQLFPPDEKREPRQQSILEQRRERVAAMDLAQHGLTFEPPSRWQPDEAQDGERAGFPGIVLGIELNRYHRRDAQGQYDFANAALGREVALTLVPLSKGGSLEAYDPVRRPMVVVNEFKSGVYEIDSQRVYVSFDWLQRQLEMHAQEYEVWDEQTGQGTGEMRTEPARATEVLVRGAEGVALAKVHEAAERSIETLREAHPDMPYLAARTWRQQHAHLLAAVQNEVGLVTFLFAIISVVAVVMVATTFYMIVLEKTRDIGVLRAVGASRLGIANVFLGYGLGIGVVGALLGLAAAVAIVTHLNEIQAVIEQWTGWQMWNPQTYYFDRIPDEVDPLQAGFIVVFAILSSVVGATIPALLASRQDPVEALRYE